MPPASKRAPRPFRAVKFFSAAAAFSTSPSSKRHRRQRAHRILGDMGARRADTAIHRAAQNVGLDPHAVAVRRKGDQPRIARFRRSVTMRDTGPAGRAPSRRSA